MHKIGDLRRNIEAVLAHIDTAVALIAQAEGQDRTLLDGYVGASITRELRESRKGVLRAQDRLNAAAPAERRRTA